MTRQGPGADLRRWLPVAGLVLAIVSLVPPLSTLARRYLWAESLQFSMFAMVCPALIALGASWRPRQKGRPSFRRGAVLLAGFAGVSLAWRLPPVLDALARVPGLVAAEAITLLIAGAGLWLELVSPPLAPRLPGPQRAVIAAFAMWSTWIVAYVLGFANSPVVQAYAGSGGPGRVADQEIAVGLVWGVAAACFLPVIFGVLFSWLREGSDVDDELRLDFPDTSARIGVRGWNRPPRKRAGQVRRAGQDGL
ncbi:MAG TPA: cytochrome c oxidase assembly protein [Streptosporangiaceae bacterium]|nr:cytochrome c oxidase assembly protein [Streptosporangiaceae bacterium]